jgi:hypothetical protein
MENIMAPKRNRILVLIKILLAISLALMLLNLLVFKILSMAFCIFWMVGLLTLYNVFNVTFESKPKKFLRFLKIYLDPPQIETIEINFISLIGLFGGLMLMLPHAFLIGNPSFFLILYFVFFILMNRKINKKRKLLTRNRNQA